MRYLAVLDCATRRVKVTGTDKMALKAAEALDPGTVIGFSPINVTEAINDATRKAAAWDAAQKIAGARPWN